MESVKRVKGFKETGFTMTLFRRAAIYVSFFGILFGIQNIYVMIMLVVLSIRHIMWMHLPDGQALLSTLIKRNRDKYAPDDAIKCLGILGLAIVYIVGLAKLSIAGGIEYTAVTGVPILSAALVGILQFYPKAKEAILRNERNQSQQ
ncbi:MAG: hypothetical protein HPY59_07515 [Anaerolineae bacterium]|nr:hypothetical protein [Anaerolineae bacterium]